MTGYDWVALENFAIISTGWLLIVVVAKMALKKGIPL